MSAKRRAAAGAIERPRSAAMPNFAGSRCGPNSSTTRNRRCSIPALPPARRRQQPGYWVFAPARLPDGRVVVINRGYVPLERANGAGRRAVRRSPAICAGRKPPAGSSPRTIPRATSGSCATLQAMAQVRGWGSVAPFYVDQEAPVPPGGLPEAGHAHGQAAGTTICGYAITWFGLAIALAAVLRRLGDSRTVSR